MPRILWITVMTWMPFYLPRLWDLRYAVSRRQVVQGPASCSEPNAVQVAASLPLQSKDLTDLACQIVSLTGRRDKNYTSTR